VTEGDIPGECRLPSFGSTQGYAHQSMPNPGAPYENVTLRDGTLCAYRAQNPERTMNDQT